MQKAIKLLVEPGTNFDNALANTPICCPSRAEIQTGRYMHNTKVLGHNIQRSASLHIPREDSG
jgi:N-acetylglucosamine-6-sulfatase